MDRLLHITDARKRYNIRLDSIIYCEADGNYSDIYLNDFNKSISGTNLQYKAYPSGTWQFAPNQWNRVGTFNSNISPSYSGWIDLFGWGSGADPTNTGTINEFIDWGENQILCNGEIVSGPWRTLLKEEWDYVLHGRHASTINGVEDARYVKAKVNDVRGVILFPDEYEHPDEILIQTNTINNSGIWNPRDVFSFLSRENVTE